MKKVYIIGTGGFAAELTEYINDNNKLNTLEQIVIEGYFDINDKNYQHYNFQSPFLGDEKNYSFPENSILYIAIGDNNIRKKIIQFFEGKNIIFENFIHHTCIISSSAKYGKGNIFCPHVIIGPKTILGDFNLVNYKTAIPHDCTVGSHNIFSPNVNITGYSTIVNNNFFGTSSTVLPNIQIGNNNKIQAGVTVLKNISNNNIVFTTNLMKNMVIYK